jgi:NAD(P)-dependent dehydrogenase (short-subunit alcohol dehydrogenase family)
MNVFVVHAIASRLSTTSPIIVNAVHPGYCKSELTRQAKFPKKMFASISEFLFARSCEEGSRSLIWAAIGTPSSTRDKEDGESVRLLQGEYIAHAQILGCSSYASSEEGKAVGERIWVRVPSFLCSNSTLRGCHFFQAETVDILSKASPKVSTIVESLNS